MYKHTGVTMFKFTILLFSQFLFLSLNAMDAPLRPVTKRKHEALSSADPRSGDYASHEGAYLPNTKDGETPLQKLARGAEVAKEEERPRLASVVIRVDRSSEKGDKKESKITTGHQFIYDAYTERRGQPKMLEIKCRRCGGWVMSYQKDGPGALLRCYLDRIHAPEHLEDRQNLQFDVRTFPRLRCNSCNVIIGVPMVYQLESRPAYKMFKDAFYF